MEEVDKQRIAAVNVWMKDKGYLALAEQSLLPESVTAEVAAIWNMDEDEAEVLILAASNYVG